MNPSITPLVLALTGVAQAAIAQTKEQRPDRPWGLYARSTAGEASITPSEELVAALQYDGSSSYGMRGQDFESIFDSYDIFLIEDIELTQDATLGEFRSVGFGNGNTLGTEDVGVRIFEDNDTGLPGTDNYTGRLILETVPGVGFFDNGEFISDFGGQCLSAGPYFVVWAARLDFSCGGSFCFIQRGESTIGGGGPNNAWLWNPGLGWRGQSHFPAVDPETRQPIGVNYLLFGTPGDCPRPCSNPDCPADFDLDGDADADDFFTFLDVFTADDPCADLTGNGTIDVNDFFAYLDLFVQGCD